MSFRYTAGAFVRFVGSGGCSPVREGPDLDNNQVRLGLRTGHEKTRESAANDIIFHAQGGGASVAWGHSRLSTAQELVWLSREEDVCEGPKLEKSTIGVVQN